jgi:hypothetical protein
MERSKSAFFEFNIAHGFEEVYGWWIDVTDERFNSKAMISLPKKKVRQKDWISDYGMHAWPWRWFLSNKKRNLLVAIIHGFSSSRSAKVSQGGSQWIYFLLLDNPPINRKTLGFERMIVGEEEITENEYPKSTSSIPMLQTSSSISHSNFAIEFSYEFKRNQSFRFWNVNNCPMFVWK